MAHGHLLLTHRLWFVFVFAEEAYYWRASRSHALVFNDSRVLKSYAGASSKKVISTNILKSLSRHVPLMSHSSFTCIYVMCLILTLGKIIRNSRLWLYFTAYFSSKSNNRCFFQEENERFTCLCFMAEFNETVISLEQWVLASVMIPQCHTCPLLHSFAINTLYMPGRHLEVWNCVRLFGLIFSCNVVSFDEIKINIGFRLRYNDLSLSLSHLLTSVKMFSLLLSTTSSPGHHRGFKTKYNNCYYVPGHKWTFV